MITAKHSGDKGDLAYFLPVMRHLGGGTLYIEAAVYTRVPLLPENWCGIDKIFKDQPYIKDVLPWNRERVDINGNDFRSRMQQAIRRESMRGGGDGSSPAKKVSLVDWMLSTHGVPLSAKDEAWISVEPNKVAPVVISRAGQDRKKEHQYFNAKFPWAKVCKKYAGNAVFIGTPREHELFTAVHGDVPHYPTTDLYDAAKAIQGCELFIGNQSAPHALAEAMKKRIVLEVWCEGPNVLAFRDGVIHGWDESVRLPEIYE